MPVENGRLEIGDYELLWMKTIEMLSVLNDEIRLVRRLYNRPVTGRRAKTKFPKEIRVYLRQYYSKEIKTEVVVDRIRNRLGNA
ncbi:Oidioi.mRNA.OKI2018_I69.XSR.g13385.t1.cds [Oikopleura dioica]|uniref:Oidioi.mRNA.OKI2018_I69.XSR.g13385.t1.cds n=1 Tax=Oikopleura dioica TaxID=34765 RepID=A0ABN7S6Q5_OIKDI|nr:Oidioi.mRNA.OKI2018_I69.XSR.g13385.t1.cds [Oikopleura dioica]